MMDFTKLNHKINTQKPNVPLEQIPNQDDKMNNNIPHLMSLPSSTHNADLFDERRANEE